MKHEQKQMGRLSINQEAPIWVCAHVGGVGDSSLLSGHTDNNERCNIEGNRTERRPIERHRATVVNHFDPGHDPTVHSDPTFSKYAESTASSGGEIRADNGDEPAEELSFANLPPDEQRAIAAALDGDLDAFNELVVKYQRMAYSVAYRMVRRADEAEDVVQDSFIKAYRALETFRGGQFKSWLMRIVVNTSYDLLRVQKRYISESIEEEPIEDSPAKAIVDKHESPQEFVERMELGAHIEMGIQSLPDEQRVVLMLCDIHGYSYEEIAEITGQAMGTVKSRINRARGKLRDYLLQKPELLPSPLRPKDT